MAMHERECFYPKEPCGCGANDMDDDEDYEEGSRRISGIHAPTCTYPSDPCDCGVIKNSR